MKNRITKLFFLFFLFIGIIYSQSFINEWEGHSGPSNAVAFSKDGLKVLTCGDDGTIRILNTIDNSIYKILQSKNNSVKRLVFSQNGDKFAVCGSNNIIEVYSFPQCNLLLSIDDTCNSICFTLDDKLVSCSDKLKIWNTTTGKNINTIQIPLSNNVIATKETGKVLLAGNDSKIYLFDYNSSQIVRIYNEHIAPILGLSLSPDGSKFASSSADRTIRVWDIANTTSWKIGFAHLGYVYSIEFSPDGTKLVTACEDTRVRLYRVDPIDVLHTYWDHVGKVYSATFSKNGNRIASIGEDGLLRYWDTIEDSYLLIESISTHTGIVDNIEYSSDGYSLVTSGVDNKIFVWDPVFGFLIKKLDGHSSNITGLHYFNDVNKIISSSKDGWVKVWDVSAGKALVNINNRSAILSLCFNDSSSKIFITDSNGIFKAYNSKGGLLKKIDSNSVLTEAIAFSKNKNIVLVGNNDGNVIIYDANDYSKKNNYSLGEKIRKIMVSIDGKNAYFLKGNNKITELNISTGVLRNYENNKEILDFSLNDNKIVFVEKGGSVKFLRVSDFVINGYFEYSTGYPTKVTFNNDGQYIALGGWGINNIKIKEVNSTLLVEKKNTLPSDFILHQNYPNPFNPSTKIVFETKIEDNYLFEVYDILGKSVYKNEFKDLQPGVHIVEWVPKNISGGTYFYTIRNSNSFKTGKMIFLK